MKVMGLKQSWYWVSWFLYYLGIFTTISIVCTVIICAKVLPNSSRGLIFLYLWLYGLSHFGYIMLMQSFFKTPRTAAIITTLVFFFTSFIDQAVSNYALPEWRKALASLLPTIAMSRAIQNIFAYELSGEGL